MVGDNMTEGAAPVDPTSSMATQAGMSGSLDAVKAGLLKKPEDVDQQATEERRALVKKIQSDVAAWEKHWKPEFDRMRRNVRFVRNKAGEQWKTEDGTVALDVKDKYVANVTQRLIQQKVASLYARNPRARAKRRPMVDYSIWDGREDTLQTAIGTVMGPLQTMQAVGAAQMGAPGTIAPPPPSTAPLMDPVTALAIVKEVISVRERRDMIDKIGKVAEILFHFTIDTAQPSFKARFKQAVRRASTTGVAWVHQDYERAYDGYRPETNDQILDTQNRIEIMEATLAEIHAGDVTPGSADLEQLKLSLQELTTNPDMIVREGITFDFPKSWDMIPDLECQQLIGLVGCKKFAKRFESTVDGIKATFKIDLGDNYTAYSNARNGQVAKRKGDDTTNTVVWFEVYDSTTGLVYSVCDGYGDFLCEPAPPRVNVPQFFPFYAIVLNEIENDEDLFPPSDVDLVEHQQRELNRSREALRQHRIASAPYTVAGKDKLSEEDVSRMRNRVAHDVILLQALMGNQKAEDVFMAGPVATIDPNLYETNQVTEDIMRSTGTQDANLGPATGNTATEAGIAEASRSAASSSNVDDLDGVLTAIARDFCRVALQNYSLETVKKIAGNGAVWPTIDASRTDYASVLFLDIIAGSSGKPNRERDAATMERIGPIMQNTPGIKPDWIARKVVELVDDTVDMDDALLSGVPSVLAMNAMMKNATGAQPAVPGAAPAVPPAPTGGIANTPTGNPATDPTQQGDQGANNMPQGMGTRGGPQAGNPGPTDALTQSV